MFNRQGDPVTLNLFPGEADEVSRAQEIVKVNTPTLEPCFAMATLGGADLVKITLRLRGDKLAGAAPVRLLSSAPSGATPVDAADAAACLQENLGRWDVSEMPGERYDFIYALGD